MLRHERHAEALRQTTLRWLSEGRSRPQFERDKLGRTALFYLAERQGTQELQTICQTVVQAGARLDATDN